MCRRIFIGRGRSGPSAVFGARAATSYLPQGVLRAVDQRRARLESLFREHSCLVLDYALNRGASVGEAEDVVAEVFLVCWRRLDVVPVYALPWLLGVARKVLANQRRSKRRRAALRVRMEHNLPRNESGGVDWEKLTDLRAELLEGLASLEEDDREVLILVAWDGLSSSEAASVLGCSRATFAVRSHRARARLLDHLDRIRTYRQSDRDISEAETV